MRWLSLLALLLAGCPEPVVEIPPPPTSDLPTAVDPGARTGLHRLTATQWRNAAQDLTGVRWEGELPADFELHGFVAVGAAETTVAPLDLELYEAAAWGVAEQTVADAAARDALFGCAVEPSPGAGELDAAPCVRAWLASFLSAAWRRPASGEEIDRLVTVFDAVTEGSGSTVLATQALVAAGLLAPDFLFRVELGVDTDDPELRLLSDHEAAARLAFTLTDRPPDAALRARASEGGLATAAAMQEQATLALATDQSTGPLTAFFAQWTDLDALWLTAKDPTQHPEWTPDLQAAMATEAELLFRDVALADGGDLRDLFTTRTGRITPELAAVYGVAPPGSLDPVELPPERAGLLTRGAFLAPNAHATLTSPTRRGKFVRSRLLCQDIAPPPEGVIASLDALPDEGTLRDRLEQHMADPACELCHSQMDPIGFAFEHFDPVGAWRDTDNDLPVDASTDLDGDPIASGAELGAALAEHPRLPRCVTSNAWRHLLGHLEQGYERDPLFASEDAFEASAYNVPSLMHAITGTLPYRTVSIPEGGACDVEASTRACATACGEGTETCVAGAWVGCSAARPIEELCNGIDDDCDGSIDEAVVEACTVNGRPGLRSCSDGVWWDCAPVVADETCNGLDDDGDGLVDEELAVDLRAVVGADLSGQHPDCDPDVWTHSPHCRAATHRACATTACATTGIGPVAWEADGTGGIVCLDDTVATIQWTTYTALGAQHGGCHQGNRFGPDCNAAINRWCSAQGLTTGYGPIENSGDDAVVACNPGATVIHTTYTEVSAYGELCNGASERMGPDCDAAFHHYCRAQGYATGHGPLENSGDNAHVACIGAL